MFINESCVFCKLCIDLKFATQGFQAIQQYSKKPKHKSISDIRFANNMRLSTQNSTSSLDRREKKLNEDEVVVNTEFDLAQQLLSSARKDLDKVITNADMVGVKVAREMV